MRSIAAATGATIVASAAAASVGGGSISIGRRARTSDCCGILALLAVIACLAACNDPWAATIPPDVPAFTPTVVGVIDRYEPPAGAGHGAFVLVDGTRVEITDATRTLISAEYGPGDLLAAGSDALGPWTAYARHVEGSTPDCFQASGIAFDDGDGVYYNGYRFAKAPDFSNPFPSTKRGHRYPVGDPCFDDRFQVLAVGRP